MTLIYVVWKTTAILTNVVFPFIGDKYESESIQYALCTYTTDYVSNKWTPGNIQEELFTFLFYQEVVLYAVFVTMIYKKLTLLLNIKVF